MTKTLDVPPSDEVDVSTQAPEQPPTAVATTAWRSPAEIASIALAAVLIVVLGVVAYGVATAHSSTSTKTEAGVQSGYLAGPGAIAAETAASNETRATLTYNYKHLASDFAAAEKGLTPSFLANYRSTTASKVSPLAVRYHAVSTAVVADAGVSAVTARTATVLLFVDQTVTNTQLAHPRLDRSRIKVSMVLTNGRWLINGLSPI